MTTTITKQDVYGSTRYDLQWSWVVESAPLKLSSTMTELKKVVGAIITNTKGEVLLVKRKAEEDFMPNAWEIAGGGVDDGESIGQALLREVLEETGLVVEDYKFVNTCTYPCTVQYNYHTPITDADPAIALTEHSEYAWVSYDDFGTYLPPGDMILGVLEDWVQDCYNDEEFIRTEEEAIAKAHALAKAYTLDNGPALPHKGS